MKRLARLVLASSFVLSVLVTTGRAALATPFSDVPANHWAYQYIQSLAADGIIDGYPDGKFKGDRPLTRYEMAVVVARVIAKLQEGQIDKSVLAGKADKADLDKLQKLIDSLKDELDSLGVRVTNLEDGLDALDKRTKFAQSISLHGVFSQNATYRQRTTIPLLVNRATPADALFAAYVSSADENLPLTANGSGAQIRQDDILSFAYQITPDIAVSFPIHIVNFEYGGQYVQQQKFTVEPTMQLNVAKTGSISNLILKFGIIDTMKSSRTGLAFRAPFGDGPSYPYALQFEEALQPYQKGVSIGGTVLGLTDFQASFTRVDQLYLNTQNAVQLDSTGSALINANYLSPIGSAQHTLVQNGTPTSRVDTFNAGTTPLSQVYLTQKGVLGSVYVAFYNGTTFNNQGQVVSTVPGAPAAPPNFNYVDQYNAVVFANPLPAGSVVRLGYTALTVSFNSNFQRYMINGRVNHKIKGWAGAEIGVTFNRVYDFDDVQTTANNTSVFALPALSGNGVVSDTVFGLDFALPIPYAISGKGSFPTLYGEAAWSKFTADYRNVPAVGDNAGVIGLRGKIQKIEYNVQYQSVGPNFLDGAPFRYFGNPPPNFAAWKLPYFPDFFGFGNNLGINQQFDNALTAIGRPSTTTTNTALTIAYPVFNPFKGWGPTFYQAFTPNTRGLTANVSAPVRIGDVTVNGRAQYQHLEELRPNAQYNFAYGPQVTSSVRMQFDTYTLGGAFTLPAFGQKLAVNLAGTYERLKRPDLTAFPYIPFNPGTQTFDAAAQANVLAGYPTGSPVSFYPNFVDMRHYIYNATATLPLTKDLGLNLFYVSQRFGGSYGTTGTQNISQRKDLLTGNVTYAIPRTNSAISLQARNYKYTDDVVPSYNLNQNRQDLLITVRF